MGVLAREVKATNLVSDLQSLGYHAVWERGIREVLCTNSGDNSSRFRLDDRGLVSEYVTPLSRTFRFEYDDESRPIALHSPTAQDFQLQYENRGLVSTFSVGTGRTWSFAWDRWGNLGKAVLPDKNSIEVASSGPGKPISFRNQMNQTTRFERDEAGTLLAVVDPNGNRTKFMYQQWNRPSKILRANGSQDEIVRDSKGRVTTAKVNGDLWTQIENDEAGVIKSMKFADGYSLSFVHDESGRVVEAKTPSAATKRKYDDQNRLLEEDQGGLSVKYSYGRSGVLESLTTPFGDTLKFTYDADGRLTEVKDWNGGVHHFRYDSSGQTIDHVFPNTVVTRTQLTGSGSVSEIRTSSASSGQQPLSLKFKRDLNNRVVALEDSEMGLKRFSYDPNGSLITVQSSAPRASERFSYDANGNRTAANGEDAEFDSLNQLVRQGSRRMAYDSRGNMVEESGPKGITRYKYNGQNLLVSADLPDGRKLTFQYDAFARRISKRLGDVVTRYVWAGHQLLCEFTEGGARPERRDYLFVPDSYAPLAMRVNGKVFQIHADHRAAPRWATDDSGEVVWSADSSAFGTIFPIKQTTKLALRFPGQYLDEETGLHYNRARYYDPSLGRYLSRDPLEFAAGINFYSYAGNDPINSADPLGLIGFWQGVLAGAAVVAGVALLVVAAPIVAAAVVAVAAGSAIAAGTALAAAGVVAGGALLGAGIGLALAPEDASAGSQALSALKGAAAGAGAALAVMGAAFGAAGAIACGGGAAAALATGGQMTVSSTAVNAVGAGMTGVVAGTMAMAQAEQGGGGGGGRRRREQTGDDTTLKNQEEAQKEALKRHGAADPDDPQLIEKKDVYGKNENLKGPNGEPSEKVTTINKDGDAIEIDHHKWGHEFEDGTYEYPHYHGPNGEHISYPPEGSSQ